MALAAMTDTDKSIYPIPKPNRLADRIHHCAKSTSTLQRQMRFEHDPKTFSALMVRRMGYLECVRVLTLELCNSEDHPQDRGFLYRPHAPVQMAGPANSR